VVTNGGVNQSQEELHVARRTYLGIFQVFGSPSKRGIASWQLPGSDILRFHEMSYWIEMAKLLDRSGFDFMFFADGYSYPAADGEILDSAVRYGINIPMLDPQLLIPTLAHETSSLGFVVTETTGIHQPIETARRFATLDHLSSGRVGMNIVTGGTQNTMAGLFGYGEIVPHDERYDRAQEYMDICRAYWNDSWEDDAYVTDSDKVVLIDRDKIHRVDFSGEFYRSSGYMTTDPSPQRTPVLFQAGTSGRGKQFAADNAEGILIQGTTPEQTAANVADIRRLADESGRDGASIKILVTMTVVVAPTAEEAIEKRRLFDEAQTDEVAAATYQGITGVELMGLDRELSLFEALAEQRQHNPLIGQMNQTNIDRFKPKPGERAQTVGEILAQLKGRGIRGFQVVGDPVGVVDQIKKLLEVTDLDGILLDPIWGISDVAEFADLVLPEMRRRGMLVEPAKDCTLRERLA
jgi:FMN-dependent oxidoreductase (nitrilotriacetate monooxygenase family)